MGRPRPRERQTETETERERDGTRKKEREMPHERGRAKERGALVYCRHYAVIVYLWPGRCGQVHGQSSLPTAEH